MEIIQYKPIPKKVHQIWLGPFDPPKEWMSSWKDGFCKQYGWEYKLWREDDLLKFGLTNKKEFDDSVSYQQKADIARYEVTYREGGLYVDCDMIWLGKDLSQYIPLHRESFVGVQESPSKSILNIGAPYLSNGIFFSAQGHHILKRCIDKIPEVVKLPTKHTFMKTGPALYNSCVKEVITLVPHQLVFPLDFHRKTNVKDPMIFKDKALIFTYNGFEYPHIKKLEKIAGKTFYVPP